MSGLVTLLIFLTGTALVMAMGSIVACVIFHHRLISTYDNDTCSGHAGLVKENQRLAKALSDLWRYAEAVDERCQPDMPGTRLHRCEAGTGQPARH